MISELVAGKIIFFLLLVPFYTVLIWTYFYTEESLMWGNRWKYKEEPELSDELIRFTKIKTILGILFLTIFSLIIFFKF